MLLGGGYLGSLFKLSDVHVIGYVIARGPCVNALSSYYAPYILPYRALYILFPLAYLVV